MKNKMTMKEFKEKYDEAVEKVLENPVKGLKGEKETEELYNQYLVPSTRKAYVKFN